MANRYPLIVDSSALAIKELPAGDGLLFADNDKIVIGTGGSDLTLYHDGTNSYITNGTGALKIATETSGIAVTIGHTTSETTVADNLTVTGDMSIGGNFDVTGTLDFSDSAITNVGDIQLDSITGDADSNTAITFSGSDVITISAAGANQVTFIDGAIVPSTDSDIDLGTSSVEFKDAFFDGTVTSDAFAGPLTGNVTGNADTATALATGRTIGMTGDVVWTSPSFDGSGNITAAATIQAGSVENSMLADDAVDSDEIAAGAIDLAHMSVNSIDSDQYVDGSIDTAHIAASQITNALMADDAIDSAEIANGAIDLVHMSVNSIDSDQYVDGSIDTIHIADDQITADKLANTAVTAGSYGTSTAIPVITVDAQGRLTAASTAAISTSFTLSADSGSNDTFNTGETLTIAGTTNQIATTVSNNQIQIGFPTDVTISGDLTVSGDTTTVNTATLAVEDPLVSLATGNNAADAVDIGIYGLYDTSGSQDLYGGLFRDASDSGKWKLFKDNQAVPTTTVNTSGTGYATGTLVANIEGAVTGNADTATALATGRTIGMTGDVVWTSASFDGSGNVTGTAAIQADSVDLTTHTTGNYVATVTAGTGLTSTGATSGEGIAHSLSVDATQGGITSLGTLSSLAVSGNQTIGGTLGVTGVISPTTHIDMPDSAIIKLGTGDDLQISHDGTHTYMSNGTGNLFIESDNIYFRNAARTEYYASFIVNGGTGLYYDNSKKLDTVTGGIDVTGTVVCDGGNFDGAATFNDTGADVDFRIESNNNANIFFVDGGNDKIGVGTTSPDSLLSVTSTGAASEDVLYLKSGADNVNEYLGIAFETAIGGNGPHAAIRAYNGPSSANDSYLALLTTTDGGTLTQGLIQDHAGRVLIGITESDFQNNYFQIEGTSSTNSSMSLFRNAASAVGPYLNFGKSRGASVNSDTVIQDDDNLGSIMFYAADGTDRNSSSAYITAAIDGTPGSDDTPGRLVFGTTSDGGNGATERMRIDSSGNLFLGMTSGHHAGSGRINFEMKGTSSAIIGFDIGGTASTYMYDSGQSGALEINHPASVYLNADTNIRFATGSNAEAMRINSDGNIGIGTTSNSHPLRIVQATSAAGLHMPLKINTSSYNDNGYYSLIGFGIENTAGAGAAIGFNRTAGYDRGSLVFMTRSASTHTNPVAGDIRMTIDKDGTVDIAGKLDVNNLTIAGAQGSDGQVLTSTGSGVGWEDASGGGGGGVTGTVGGANFTNSILVGHTTTGTLSSADGNVGIGANAMNAITSGDQNVFIGYNSGTDATDASYNVGVGALSLENVIGNSGASQGMGNVAVGQATLQACTTGSGNVAIGSYDGARQQPLKANTTGSGNVAIGTGAMQSNVTGSGITAVGKNAMTSFAASGDNRNTAIGHGALFTFNGNPGFCTVVGEYAGYSLTGTSVGYNTFVGTHSGYQLGSGSQSNTAIGARAMQGGAGGATGNVAVGMDAGYSLTSADYVTAVGLNAVNANQTNDYLTGVGYNSLRYITSGNDACAVGANTLSSSSNTNANGNHAFGYHAFHGVTTGGDGLVAVGRQAGNSQTTADQSVYVGKSAGWGANSGQSVGVGRRALQGVSTGNGNTAIGFQTMYSGPGTGANNTYVGAYCGQSTSGSNNFGLGYQAAYSGSPGGAPAGNNEGYLGDENITTINAQVGITAASDKRDKNDIEPLTLGLEFINKLEPVTYRWDKRTKYIKKYMLDLPKDDPDFVDLDDVVHDGTHTEPQLHAGLLAQDVEEIEQSYGFDKEDKTALVTTLSGDGKAYSLQYERFVPMLIKSVQELSTQVESLKEEIEELKND